MARRVSPLLAFFFVTALLTAPASQAQESLGRIEFPTSHSGAAQDAFVKGVLLLHSFEYEDAREAFLAAQQAAPDFAMAFWGEAMTYNHPLWNETSLDLARAALARLAPAAEQRLAKAATDKERDWLRAVETLYGDGEKPARDSAYAGQMRRMHDKYPDDLEVTAFTALAMLGASQGRDVPTYMRAAALVDEVYRRNPEHPGAVHYLIQAFDDPVHAPLALRYADAYAKLAPPASYSLHLPSHIYFALGMWDQAAEMNERSIKAADDRIAQKSLGVDERGYHALLWLTYSYLQQGRQQDAKAVLNQIEDAAARSGAANVRSHLALARAAWLIETRKWAEAKAPVDAEGVGTAASAADLFAIGLAAFRSGNRPAGSDALQRIAVMAGDGDRPLRSVTTARPTPAGRPPTSRPGVVPIPTPRPAMPSFPGVTPPEPQPSGPPASTSNEKRVAAVMAQQLEAALIFAEGRREEAIVLARQAAAVEEELRLEVGPSLPVKPGHELVGDMLMDVRRPGEAVVAYEAALKRQPGRALSLLGLYRSATAVKNTEKAQQASAELRKVWRRADKTLPELREIMNAPSSSF
jgi:tetratricopeptide (TPR) repeat protein